MSKNGARLPTGAVTPPKSQGRDPGATLLHLSPRESQVLAWIAQGRTNPQIAQHLGLSRDSVKDYAGNVYRKLGVPNRIGALLWLAQHQPALLVPASPVGESIGAARGGADAGSRADEGPRTPAGGAASAPRLAAAASARGNGRGRAISTTKGRL